MGKKQREEDLNQIRIGMHRTEVESLLGKPESITRDASRNIVYGYSHHRVKGSFKNYIPVYSWVTPTQINTESQSFTIYFDKNERIKDFDQIGSSVPTGYNSINQNNNRDLRSNVSNQAPYIQERDKSSSPQLTFEQAKKQLLNKYLNMEITKDEYLQLYKELHTVYRE